MKLSQLLSVTIILAFGNVVADESAGPFEVGVYGSAWTDWVIENRQALDFMIYQAGSGRTTARIGNDLAAVKSAGVDVIVVIRLFSGDERKSPAADDSINRYLGRIHQILAIEESNGVRAFTLDEENIFWGGRAAILSDLYRSLKDRYESVAWYQWYSGSRKPNPPGGRWPDLPADGWIFDQYSMTGADFRLYVSSMISREQPLVAVVWASPDWPPGPRNDAGQPNWWDEQGWREFYAQVAILRDLHIPTAFFMYQVDEAGQVTALWNSPLECARSFVQFFTSHTFQFLRGSVAMAATTPHIRPSWIPAGCPSEN